ncbi:MAG: hypothetical protein N2444_04310 [Methylocystis sp.]|nr:hypothetical protein [Methylocystis sp.]
MDWAELFGGNNAKRTFERTAARRLNEMELGMNAGFGEKSVISGVRANVVGWRSINPLQFSMKVIVDDFAHAVHGADGDDIEKPRGEFRKQGTNAAARDDGRAASLEEERKLAHPVEINL